MLTQLYFESTLTWVAPNESESYSGNFEITSQKIAWKFAPYIFERLCEFWRIYAADLILEDLALFSQVHVLVDTRKARNFDEFASVNYVWTEPFQTLIHEPSLFSRPSSAPPRMTNNHVCWRVEKECVLKLDLQGQLLVTCTLSSCMDSIGIFDRWVPWGLRKGFRTDGDHFFVAMDRAFEVTTQNTHNTIHTTPLKIIFWTFFRDLIAFLWISWPDSSMQPYALICQKSYAGLKCCAGLWVLYLIYLAQPRYLEGLSHMLESLIASESIRSVSVCNERYLTKLLASNIHGLRPLECQVFNHRQILVENAD